MNHHKLVEHYLIPTVLFCLNIAFVHAIYRLATRPMLVDFEIIVCLFAVLLLCVALYTKTRWLLIGSSVFYLFLLLLVIN
ncbi:hypothetical protein [Parapedobacter koreensis]|uniref:Uncharacterized protein n=1 Tax=Parapedobacter koreensis TaxID=332977 RepID=A0A1H7FWV0_9SPHI|nr:hypothetical protein [Parapedobacter koreensis]SEK30408.1 hypothetical protein SAMN05421740_101488 [Parapedobacter koreensis]